MKIGILALQGAFAEHAQMLRTLGADTFEIRQNSDLNQPVDGLVIPGGESTVQLKLLNDLDLLVPMRRMITDGMPVFGTCAGLILLSKKVDGQAYGGISTMNIQTCRNAYGRQLGSFYAESVMEGVGEKVPMPFIRAPYIQTLLSDECQTLATVEGRIVAAREGNQLVTAFHPELTNDTRVHRFFLNIVSSADSR
ncbi:pyridoxal 5'-phosphate synthase, glutaminase subunit Pdx2 [Hoylesella oralis ATCC 33269]|uniref:Pyridoxal 5'-phosphate synthase subunit PdxT n=3 Tax=Hoylesella oralis TaxID=28134 RepID=E7RSP3_9BACT|nr:pyridoxal 5'-phosphate synthase glutaminase subunit PdxT [Hoylesella oralis]EFZ36244.1 pyridoxal 5'-phosphate synthase, glutaminase subunit Pdx2 [Hoylesella oralis ATCC 33269]EPH19293.1 pyridoxal 5'-phosphate synthase, glutaminase subunit Pdx2 [Hoylesella oralis HGA0225]